MEMLLPDQLVALWKAVEEKRLTAEEFTARQESLLQEYEQLWVDALMLEGRKGLRQSVLFEIGQYVQCPDPAEVQKRCEGAVQTLKGEWHAQVPERNRESIERFYDRSQTTVYELMWWHSLGDDKSPLSYVTALHFARQHGCRQYLDFGAGVGSGGILFARHGFDVTLADISSTLLQFCRWRLERRGLPGTCIDLKTQGLPAANFDFVTAMDVFEHLVDPVDAVERLWKALRPGGFLYARIDPDDHNENRPQHIVHDFAPTYERMRELGFVKIWRDAWLWGHQVFQKPSGG